MQGSCGKGYTWARCGGGGGAAGGGCADGSGAGCRLRCLDADGGAGCRVQVGVSRCRWWRRVQVAVWGVRPCAAGVGA